MDKAIRQILQEDHNDDTIKATNRHVRYDFTIEGRAKVEHDFNGAQIFNMKMSFHDAPGGAMFTTKRSVWEDQESTRLEMLSEAKGAYTLIFCFDGSSRQARMMQSSLARILPLLQSKRRGRYMYPMRVVILLNKIDQVCDDFYNKLAKEFPSLIDNQTITPETIAADLDPLAMAIECLGYESLKSAMRPDAELAVGVISTWGFNYEGKPLVGANGRPNFLTIANRGHGNDFVSQWRPFGIRETLIYLATGRGSQNLHIMRPGDFNQTTYAPRSIHLQNNSQPSPHKQPQATQRNQSRRSRTVTQPQTSQQPYPNRPPENRTGRRANAPERRSSKQAYPAKQTQTPSGRTTSTPQRQRSRQGYPNRQPNSRQNSPTRERTQPSPRQEYPPQQRLTNGPQPNARGNSSQSSQQNAQRIPPSTPLDQAMNSISSRSSRSYSKSPYSRNKRR